MREFYLNKANEFIGETIREVFYCEKVGISTSSQGKNYATFTLRDRTGIMHAKMWSGSLNGNESEYGGKFINVIAKISVYDGNPSMFIDYVVEAPVGSYDSSDIVEQLKDAQKDAVLEKLGFFINSIQDIKLREFVKKVFNKSVLQEYLTLPAGLKHHHNFNGALLVHTLEVCQITCDFVRMHKDMAMFKSYATAVNEDIAMAGALLHDVGKVLEYKPFPENKQTKQGLMLGHLSMGSEILACVNMQMGDNRLDDDVLTELKHIILSSHGEFGVCKPQTLEAIIVCNADEMSASTDYYSVFCCEYQKNHPGDTEPFIYSNLKGQYFFRKDV